MPFIGPYNYLWGRVPTTFQENSPLVKISTNIFLKFSLWNVVMICVGFVCIWNSVKIGFVTVTVSVSVLYRDNGILVCDQKSFSVFLSITQSSLSVRLSVCLNLKFLVSAEQIGLSYSGNIAFGTARVLIYFFRGVIMFDFLYGDSWKYKIPSISMI